MGSTTPGGPPAPGDQKKIIANAEDEEESVNVYALSKHWHQRWCDYVGVNETGAPVTEDPPGPLDMDGAEEENNMYVDEKIWLHWVDWYGVAPSHELDRRNWASDEKDYEICVLSPYSGIIENPVKTFDLSEETGYIEMQLRRIFQVSEHRKSRLWACEKARHARFQPMFDRAQQICFQDAIDYTKDYILSLEVANSDGSWPTLAPGEPQGDLDRFLDVSKGPPKEKFWEKELEETVETVFLGIVSELQETASGIVNTTKCVTEKKEKEMIKTKTSLDQNLSKVADMKKTLDEKLKEVCKEEERLRLDAEKLKKDKDKVGKDRQKLDGEIQRMEEVNQIQDSRLKLDIGGHSYTTSTLTLTRDPDSMLAAMFSGRHSLSIEKDGSYFIDRDGTHFRYILNYLRDGGFKEGSLPTDKGLLNELLSEAEYYQIAGLVASLRDILARLPDLPEDGDDDRGHPKKPIRKVAKGVARSGQFP